MSVNAEQLASFDVSQNAWVAEAGTYSFQVGASSREIKAELTADVAAKITKVSMAFVAR